MVISSVAQVQMYFDLTPSGVDFHNFVNLSTKSPIFEVDTIAECRLDSKRSQNQKGWTVTIFWRYTVERERNYFWLYLRSGGRLNKKDGLTRYGDSHVKDKTS